MPPVARPLLRPQVLSHPLPVPSGSGCRPPLETKQRWAAIAPLAGAARGPWPRRELTGPRRRRCAAISGQPGRELGRRRAASRRSGGGCGLVSGPVPIQMGWPSPCRQPPFRPSPPPPACAGLCALCPRFAAAIRSWRFRAAHRGSHGRFSSAVCRALLLRASGWRQGSIGLDASIGPAAGARQIRRAGDGAGLLLLASAPPRARPRAVPGRATSALTAAAAVRGHALPCARSFAAAHLIGEGRRRAPLAVVAGRRSATRAVELRRAAPVEDAAASAASQHRLTSLLSGRHTHRTRCREPSRRPEVAESQAPARGVSAGPVPERLAPHASGCRKLWFAGVGGAGRLMPPAPLTHHAVRGQRRRRSLAADHERRDEPARPPPIITICVHGKRRLRSALPGAHAGQGAASCPASVGGGCTAPRLQVLQCHEDLRRAHTRVRTRILCSG